MRGLVGFRARGMMGAAGSVCTAFIELLLKLQKDSVIICRLLSI